MALLPAFLLSAAFALPAEPAPAGGETAPAPLRIVTSFYPIYISTLNVVKDVPGVQVAELVKPFVGCLHDYQLSPDDLKTLSHADVFVINGAGMEAFLDKAAQSLPGLNVLNASKGIELIKTGRDFNPHVWLDISLAIKQVENIAAGLARRDPAHAFLYMRNCDAYVRQLEDLRGRMKSELAKLKGRRIVTFHDAFPYFAREFDLDIVAVVEREPGSEPSAREMAETIQVIREKKARAICIEPQYPDKSALAIARETGVAVCVLDPAVTGPATADAYIKIMEKNLATLLKTLKD